MIKKIFTFLRIVFKITYRLTVIGLTLFMIGVGLLFWHLKEKPLDLAFLMPQIQSHIFSTESGLHFDVDSITLSAQLSRNGLFHIQATNFVLYGKNDVLILDLPSVQLSYGLLSLLTLNYIPPSVQIDHALLQLTLTKNAELLLQGQHSNIIDSHNSTTVSLPKQATPSAEKALVVRDLRQFAKKILTFKRIDLNKASINITDEKNGRHIIIPQLNFSLKKRRLRRYDLEIDTAVRIQNDLMSFKGTAQYHSGTQTIELDIFFNQANLSRAGRVIPLLEGIKIPLRGEINGSLDIAEGRKHWRNAFKSLNFTITTTNQGTVQLPEPLNTIYPVRQLVAHGSFAENLESLKIEKAKVSLVSGLSAYVDIQTTHIGSFLDKQDFNLTKTTIDARLNNIPMQEIPSVWPSYLGPDAHEWVKQNLKTGLATQALFSLYFQGGDIVDLIGDVDFQDTTVDYLKPMKPVLKTAGKVMLYPDKVEIFARTGQIGQIHLNTGNVYLTNLKSNQSMAKIELDVTGPTQEILALIDEKPLQLLSGFNINPRQTNAIANGQATLVFPLTEKLTPQDVIVDVKASVQNGTFYSEDKKHTLTNSTLNLTVNNHGLVIQGNGTYQNIPLKIKWEEFFKPTKEKPIQSIYTLSGQVSDSLLKTYYQNISDYVIGTIQGDIIYQKNKDKSSLIRINSNLTQAELMIYPLAYTKVKGVPSHLTAQIQLTPQNNISTGQIDISADSKVLDISATLNAEKNQNKVILSRIQAPGSNLSGSFSWNDKQIFSLTLKGKSWLMTELKNMPYFKKQNNSLSGQSQNYHHMLGPILPLDIDISLDSMTLNAKAPLKNVRIQAKRPQTKWEQLFLFAQGTQAVSLNLIPTTDKIEGVVNDVGDLLNRLNISGEFAHGKATLSAQQNETGTIDGHIHIQNLDFKNPGFITQALTILGIIDAVRGKELNFSRGQIPFELSPHFDITLKEGVLYGTSLGITFSGQLSAHTIKIIGSVIPAYAVNSLPGRIPLIGGLFRGTQHGGLMGVQYEVKGTPSEMKIDFNPLSSIAPGILSKLFQ